MSYSQRLALIRARAITLGLSRVAAIPGLFSISNREVVDTFDHLPANHSSLVPNYEVTSDDSSEEPIQSQIEIS